MSLGYPTTKNDLDALFGGIAVDMRNVMDRAKNAQILVLAFSDQELIDRGYLANPDIARMRSGADDFNHLADIYLGVAAGVQASPLDFRRFTKFWLGTA